MEQPKRNSLVAESDTGREGEQERGGEGEREGGREGGRALPPSATVSDSAVTTAADVGPLPSLCPSVRRHLTPGVTGGGPGVPGSSPFPPLPSPVFPGGRRRRACWINKALATCTP